MGASQLSRRNSKQKELARRRHIAGAQTRKSTPCKWADIQGRAVDALLRKAGAKPTVGE